MILHLTSSCNLSCSYCFATPTQTDINLTGWKLICDKNPTRDFHLSGGEPLFVWNEITKPIIEYIQDVMYPNMHSNIDISTNGTMLTDEIAQFLKYRKIMVWVSFHGDKTYMDSLNTNYYDSVIAGLDILKKYDIPIQLRMTVNKNNVDQVSYVRSIAIEYNSTFSVIQRYFGDNSTTRFTKAKESQITAIKSLISPLILNSTWEGVRSCQAPAPAIKPDGKVIPCSAMWNTILGDALTEDMSVILSRWTKDMEFGCRRNS